MDSIALNEFVSSARPKPPLSEDSFYFSNITTKMLCIIDIYKKMIKVFVRLVMHTYFIGLRERTKNIDWTRVLNIWLVFPCCF